MRSAPHGGVLDLLFSLTDLLLITALVIEYGYPKKWPLLIWLGSTPAVITIASPLPGSASNNDGQSVVHSLLPVSEHFLTQWH